MRVLIDGTSLLLRSAGVKNYVYYWIRALWKAAGREAVGVYPFLDSIGVLSHERSPLGRAGTWARIGWVLFSNIRGNPVLDFAIRGVDVFHASLHTANPPRSIPLTGTLHDFTCSLMPETHTAGNVAATLHYSELLKKSGRRVIAVSEQTKSDAVRLMGFDPDRVDVIYHGVDDAYRNVASDDVSRVRAVYGLTKPYVLFVGTIEPRKNVGLLLDAYAQLRSSTRGEFDLVVVGPKGWSSEGVIARLNSELHGVRYLGYVPEKDLPFLTAGAAVFIYPSLYEGFGFPVAQAMAAGAPVITSNVSSLPEIAGDTAVLIDPRSVTEMTTALERVLLNPSLAKDLAARGRVRAARFTWDRCAKESLAFFERAAS
jgi:glycosyltransferase involved in cell wall biosynthesis